MDGILLVDKPHGPTSHDIVEAIKKRFDFKKVGHAGTLDPMATGLLVILIGKATKKAQYFLNDDKTYRALLSLGITTNSGDTDGEIIKKEKCSVSLKDIENALRNFIGEIEQVPPMFSAKKYKGKKLYEYARRGIEIKREPQKITIKKIEILHYKAKKVFLEISCSKGTYIRQLAIDIGKELGCGAHLSDLRRIRSGNFTIDDSIKFKELLKSADRKIVYENFIQY